MTGIDNLSELLRSMQPILHEEPHVFVTSRETFTAAEKDEAMRILQSLSAGS